MLFPIFAEAQIAPNSGASEDVHGPVPPGDVSAASAEASTSTASAPAPQPAAETPAPGEETAWITERQRFVVGVERGEHAGSGLLIGSEGLVLTARSVVDTRGTLRVWTYGGKRFEARVIAVDDDLAVLKIDNRKLPRGAVLTPPRHLSEIEVGEALRSLSLPLVTRPAGLRSLPARLPAMPAFLRVARVEPDALYAEGRFGPAAAGAAVFAEDGAFIGVNTGDPSLPYMLGRIADARSVLEQAQHPETQPTFKPKPERAFEGGLGVTFGEAGVGIDDRIGFRRNHLLLSLRASFMWAAIQPERAGVFTESSRFFVMPALGATWKIEGGSLSTSLGGALGSVQRTRVIVNEQGKRSESRELSRIRPMLDLTIRDHYFLLSAATELWRDPTLFLSIGLGFGRALGTR